MSDPWDPLLESLRPNRIDQELSELRNALGEFARAGWMGAKVPKEYGGLELDAHAFFRLQTAVARASGALALTQIQHQSACGFLAQSENADLKREWLPRMATGEIGGGIAFSQLRRAGPPPLRAEKHAGGYVLTGTAPWITGWGLFDVCVTAASLPSGEALFALHELRESEHLRPSEILRLAALEVCRTVRAEFKRLPIPQSRVLYIRPADWIRRNDMINLAVQSQFALGCAQAALDVLDALHERKGLAAIGEARDALQRRLDECRADAESTMAEKDDVARAQSVRARAIELAVRCAHAAVAAASGAGNSMDHPAQRVYREALLFTVLGQSPEILDGTLRRLAGPV